MPLFDSLLSLVPSWSPSRRRSNPPPPSRPPPSHDISDSQLRTQPSGDSVEFLGLSRNTDEISGFEPCLSDRNPSYAERIIPSQKHPAVRQPRRPPRMRFGMSVLEEGRRPTGRQSDTKDDERRLFGDYSAGPNPVRIRPGETSTKNKSLKGLSPFKPWDTITGKRKESGPVRARGKNKHQTYGACRSRLENAEELDSERPAKRRRQDQVSVSSRRAHLDNDGGAGQAASASDSGKHPTKKKDTRKFPGALGEHRYIDRNNGVNWSKDSPQKSNRQHYSSEGETDEQFTEIAANQRRLSAGESDAALGRNLKPNVFQNVEILVPRGSVRERGESQSTLLQKQFVESDGSQRNSEMKPSGRRSSDSPDELQGSPTVNPSPGRMIRRSKGDVSGAEWWPGSSAGVSSPSDIQPTNFTTRQSNRSKPKPRTEDHEHFQFDVVFVRVGLSSPLVASDGPLEIRVDNKHIEVTEPTGHQSIVRVPLEKFIRLLQGENPSGKVRLQMCKTELGDWMDIELSSQAEKRRFTSLFRNRIGVLEKPSQWMDNAFEKAKNRLSNGSKRPLEISPIAEKPPEPRVETKKRPKLSDSLQDDYGKTNSGDYLSLPPRKSGRTSRTGTHSPTTKPDSILGFEIPVKIYKPSSSPLRETRSMVRHQSLEPIVCDDDDDQVSWESTPDPPSGKWSKPLVYPRSGRNTAEVHAQDRERLRGSEFLNDNLIGFYIRFLEEHLNRANKEVAKRVYFFNSFFFTAITNTRRGQRGINYKSVEKWTRNVDLFSYDYIVVPINEAAHWYVAIICNLPSLQGASGTESQNEPEADKNASRPTSETQEVPETPDPSQEPDDAMPPSQDAGPKEEVARHSLATMSLSDNADPAVNNPKENATADEDWPEFEENPTSSPARFSSSADKAETPKGSQETPARAATASQKGKKQKKKPIPPRQKYDVRQPIIITFDSLDLGRSPTISTLREYLYEEAMSKKGVEIETKRIKGMTARQIPLQRNFSDCGLYLLAYLEKFIQNPDEFVTKLLRKEMDTKSDWPLLKSGLLRRRLRNFLDELYDEQEQIDDQKESTGKTMVDKQPITYLLGPDPERDPSQQSPSGGPSKRQTGVKSKDSTPMAESDKEQAKPKDKKASKEQAPARAKNDGEKADEIVEVPDSQDGGMVTRSTKGHKHSKPSDGQRDVASAHEDGSEQAGNLDPEDTGDSIVEVQVTGTPSPEPAPKAQEKIQKSPKAPKSKE